LIWLLTLDNLKPYLRLGVEEELQRRGTRRRATPEPEYAHTETGLQVDKAKEVYRRLAFQFHPDHGAGNELIMVGINLFYEGMKAGDD
jgi:hypothetical protein